MTEPDPRMTEAEHDAWRERLARANDAHVRTGDDPRWRKLGDASEMGVLSGLGWANFIAELGVPLREIPAEFWALDADEAGEPVAMVACPCGHAPSVPKHVAPVECQARRPSTCPRYFFFDGGNVYAFNSPPKREPGDGPTQVRPPVG